MRLLHDHVGVRLGDNHQPVTIRWRLFLYRVQAVEAQWAYTGKWWRIPLIPNGSQPCSQYSCYRQPCYGQSCYRQSCYEQPSYYRLCCVPRNAEWRNGVSSNGLSSEGAKFNVASLNARPVRMEIFREGASWVLARLLD